MKKIFLTAALFLSFFSAAHAQIQTESHLDGAMVTAIQPEGNYIWFATYGQGIYRYSIKDQKWFNFSTKNQNSESDFFYTIAVSKDYLWAGTVEGLFIYDIKRNQWRKRKFAQGGELGNWIRALCFDPSQDVLWIGRFKNLTRLDVKKNQYKDIDLTVNNDSKTNNFKTIKLDSDSLVWFGTESGVHIYDKSKDFLESSSGRSPTDKGALSDSPALGGQVPSVNDKSAWRFFNNKGNNFNDGGEAVSISDILLDNNFIWFATDEFITKDRPHFNIGGVYRFDRKSEWDRISKKNGLSANGIYCLARTGNKIWAGIYTFSSEDKKDFGRGLALIDRLSEKVTPLDFNAVDLNSRQVLSLYFDGTSMWIGTDSGLYRVKIDNPLAHWALKKETRLIKSKRKKN